MKLFAMATLVILGITGCAPDQFGVEEVRPGLGVIRGGEEVTIEGSGFDRAAAPTVYFGDRRAERITIAGTDTIVAVTPEVEAPGKVDVRLIAADGTQLVVRDGFEFARHNRMAECVNISRALNGRSDEHGSD